MDALALTLSLLRTAGLPAGATADDLKRAVFESDTAVVAALEQQLGLKLVSERAPLDLLVVDRADRVPTAD